MNELTVDDLANHPVWEFALDDERQDGQDETTIRPFNFVKILDPADGMFVVRAQFRLADRTRVSGYLKPPVHGDDGLGTIQPTIITPTGQVLFWWGTLTPSDNDIVRSYKRLGRSLSSHVFPIAFESDVCLVGGPVRGELPGFLVLEQFFRRTRIVR